MTLRYIDGCEELAGWTSTGGTVTIGTGRNGNGFVVGSQSAFYAFPGTWISPTITAGFAIKTPAYASSLSNGTYIMRLWDDPGTTVQCALCWGPAGQLAVYQGATQLGVSANGVIAVGVWQYVEVQITVHDTAGTAVVRVNGTVVLNLSAKDTKAAPVNANVGAIDLGGNGVSPSATIDDFYLMTGVGDSFQGDCRVETLYPNGNGSTNAWTNSASTSVNNWSYVDENPIDTSDYVASSTTGQQDLYAMTDLVSTAQAVLAVQPTTYAARTDGTTRSVKMLTRRLATTGQTAQALDNLANFVIFNVLTTDPDTGAAWLPGNVNALQVGVEAA